MNLLEPSLVYYGGRVRRPGTYRHPECHAAKTLSDDSDPCEVVVGEGVHPGSETESTQSESEIEG